MFFFSVFGLMLVFPLLSISYAVWVDHLPLSTLLIAKWLVFWAVGMRLFLAGLKQVIQPRYTAEKILGIKGEDVLLVVRELGFANLSIGAIAIASIHFSEWTLAACLGGGIFYGLAGVNHVFHKQRNALQNAAMVSDLCAGAVLLICLLCVLR